MSDFEMRKKGIFFYFVNKENNSELRGNYIDARNFADGSAPVKLQGGNWHFLDEGGSLSADEYYSANKSSYGYSVVQPLKDGEFFFRNTKNGTISADGYSVARGYSDGVAEVQKHVDSPWLYRDIIGAVHKYKETARLPQQYMDGKIDFKQLINDYPDPSLVCDLIYDKESSLITKGVNTAKPLSPATVTRITKALDKLQNAIEKAIDDKEKRKTERSMEEKTKTDLADLIAAAKRL